MVVVPALLRAREFSAQTRPFCYLDVNGNWQDIDLPAPGLAFTWCQVPFVYRLGDAAEHNLAVEYDDGTHSSFGDLVMPADVSAGLFARNGKIRKVTVALSAERLFGE